MNQSRKYLIGIVVAAVLFVGLVGVTVHAQMVQEDQAKDYKMLMRSFNSSVESLRTGGNPYNSFVRIQGMYFTLVDYENRDFSDDPELVELDNQIENDLASFVGAWRSYRRTVNYSEQLYNNGLISRENYIQTRNMLYERTSKSSPEK